MKIAFFTDSYFPRKDGVSYTLKAWKERLEERGHDVQLVYPGSNSYEPEENEIGVFSLPNPLYKDHRFPIPLRYSKFPEADVVHCHGPGPLGLAGRIYGELKGKTTFFTFHTPLEEYLPHIFGSKILSKPFNKIYRFYESYLMKSFDLVTSSIYNIERDVPLTKLPVGIDLDFFQPKKEEMFDEWDIKRPVIGYSGRVSEEKNLDEIVEFAQRFDGTVVIAGEGRDRENLEQKASENVLFLNFLPREYLPAFFSSIDIFVTASTGDTFCLTALEANACGTPVVAPDVPPFTEIIDDNGLRYSKGDLNDLNNKVERVLKEEFDPRKSAQKYSLEKTIDDLEELYQREIDGI